MSKREHLHYIPVFSSAFSSQPAFKTQVSKTNRTSQVPGTKCKKSSTMKERLTTKDRILIHK